MDHEQTVFSQLLQFISYDDFYICVRRYDGNKGIRRLSCWEQFLAMAFAQLTYRESLREGHQLSDLHRPADGLLDVLFGFTAVAFAGTFVLSRTDTRFPLPKLPDRHQRVKPWGLGHKVPEEPTSRSPRFRHKGRLFL